MPDRRCCSSHIELAEVDPVLRVTKQRVSDWIRIRFEYYSPVVGLEPSSHATGEFSNCHWIRCAFVFDELMVELGQKWNVVFGGVSKIHAGCGSQFDVEPAEVALTLSLEFDHATLFRGRQIA